MAEILHNTLTRENGYLLSLNDTLEVLTDIRRRDNADLLNEIASRLFHLKDIRELTDYLAASEHKMRWYFVRLNDRLYPFNNPIDACGFRELWDAQLLAPTQS